VSLGYEFAEIQCHSSLAFAAPQVLSKQAVAELSEICGPVFATHN